MRERARDDQDDRNLRAVTGRTRDRALEDLYRRHGIDPNRMRCRTCGGLDDGGLSDRRANTGECEYCGDPDPLNLHRGY